MRTLARLAAPALALFAAGSATGDVFFEITVAGRAPDGLADEVPLLTPAAFDVYVWGSGEDTALLHTDFAVAAVDRFGWLMMDLGVADPAGLFDEQNHGAFGFFPDGILGIAVQSAGGVPLPGSMANAMKIYEGFIARPDALAAAMELYPVIVTTNNGAARVVHTTGVVEAPAPAAGLALVGALLGRGRRRSR